MSTNLKGMQNDIRRWVIATFGWSAMDSPKERAFRALEEATEAVQAFLTKEEAQTVLDQVYAKPVEPILAKEIGGALFTMIALADCNKIDAANALDKIYIEVLRIDPVKIINKHLTKPARDMSLDEELLAVRNRHQIDTSWNGA